MAEQAGYTLPADFLLPRSISLQGRPLEASDRETVRQYEQGLLRMQPSSVWYEAVNSEGTRNLTLYPTPTEAGLDLELEYVYEGTPFNTSEPNAEPDEFPEWFHPKLRFFVAEIYYETAEDNAELAEQQKAKADLAISELVRHDVERGSASGIFQVPIKGWTA